MRKGELIAEGCLTLFRMERVMLSTVDLEEDSSSKSRG